MNGPSSQKGTCQESPTPGKLPVIPPRVNIVIQDVSGMVENMMLPQLLLTLKHHSKKLASTLITYKVSPPEQKIAFF